MHMIANITQRKILLLAIALFALGIGLIVWLLFGSSATKASSPQPAPDSWSTELSSPENESQTVANTTQDNELQATAAPALIIYVSGAVVAPDVYVLPANARTKDAILAAGGFTTQADPEAINLAAPLKDGQHIQVPSRSQANSDQTQSAISQATPKPGSPSQPTAGGLLDLNTASATDLEELPGIGQALAGRIIEYRESNGPFTSVEDLRKVRGIGASLFEQIATLVTVTP